MTGRNTHPKQDGQRATPSRLDQYGETLANDNDAADLTSAQRNAVEGEEAEEGFCGYAEK
jgi:hypothetical protein